MARIVPLAGYSGPLTATLAGVMREKRTNLAAQQLVERERAQIAEAHMERLSREQIAEQARQHQEDLQFKVQGLMGQREQEMEDRRLQREQLKQQNDLEWEELKQRRALEVKTTEGLAARTAAMARTVKTGEDALERTEKGIISREDITAKRLVRDEAKDKIDEEIRRLELANDIEGANNTRDYQRGLLKRMNTKILADEKVADLNDAQEEVDAILENHRYRKEFPANDTLIVKIRSERDPVKRAVLIPRIPWIRRVIGRDGVATFVPVIPTYGKDEDWPDEEAPPVRLPETPSVLPEEGAVRPSRSMEEWSRRF